MRVRTASLIWLSVGCVDGVGPANSPAAAASSSAITFVGLQAGDSLRVHVKIDACFLTAMSDLLFATNSDGSVLASGVTRYERPDYDPSTNSPDEVPRILPVPRQAIGVSERQDLDEWLTLYRSPSNQVCSSSMVLTLALTRAGAAMRTETLRVTKCGSEGRGAPPDYSLYQLMASADLRKAGEGVAR